MPWKLKKIKPCWDGNSVALRWGVEQTLMPAQQSLQPGNWNFVNTIQVLEDLVDRVFRKHDFTTIASSPSTVHPAVLESFPLREELLEVA